MKKLYKNPKDYNNKVAQRFDELVKEGWALPVYREMVLAGSRIRVARSEWWVQALALPYNNAARIRDSTTLRVRCVVLITIYCFVPGGILGQTVPEARHA